MSILGGAFFIYGLFGLWNLVNLVFLTPPWIWDKLNQRPAILILLWGIILSRLSCIIIAINFFNPFYKIKKISITLAGLIIVIHLFDIIKLVGNASFFSKESLDFDMGVLLFDILITISAGLAVYYLNKADEQMI